MNYYVNLLHVGKLDTASSVTSVPPNHKPLVMKGSIIRDQRVLPLKRGIYSDSVDAFP